MSFSKIARTVTFFLLPSVILLGCDGLKKETGPPQGMQTTAPDPRGGVSHAAAVAQKHPLSGTAWRLVEIQSMDDTVGTVRPEDPSMYFMRLNNDGTVAMRLNCNRASGTWSAEAGSEPTSGRFVFGPLASTQAVCPLPSLDERVSVQAGFVRSYLLRDGRLYLSLMADGGIYVWEPGSDIPFMVTPDRELEAAILQAEPDYTRDVVDMEGGTGRGRYVYSRVDLNNDGRDEVFVYLLGSIFCGTGGCNLLLFTAGSDGYTLVNNFPTSRVPVIVSPGRTEGWNDLFRLQSGGGAPASYVLHTFDGTHYIDQERMPAQKAPEGMRCLTGDLTFDKGVPLAPWK